MGWLVPALLIGFMILTQFTADLVMGDGYYTQHAWTKNFGVIGGVVLIGLVGIYLNHIRRLRLTDEASGEQIREKSHSFFFIPMEYWALILPAIWFVLLSGYVY